MENVYKLRDRHYGEDVWIVAAGPSMDYVSPSFFENKVSIGVNQVYRKFHTDYLVRKEAEFADEARATGIPLIVSRYRSGTYKCGLNPAADFVYDHMDNGLTAVDLSVIRKAGEKIVVSYSTITSAMHIAAVMGAANIILCGHDCGTLDGKSRMSGYNEALMGDERYRKWLGMIQPQTVMVRERIREVFWPCEVYSLSPFVGLNLEGHVSEC
jgi:hypothetical protein